MMTLSDVLGIVYTITAIKFMVNMVQNMSLDVVDIASSLMAGAIAVAFLFHVHTPLVFRLTILVIGLLFTFLLIPAEQVRLSMDNDGEFTPRQLVFGALVIASVMVLTAFQLP